MTDTAFPDHEYLTVRELAELLRLNERKVYDLAASAPCPVRAPRESCGFPLPRSAPGSRAQSGETGARASAPDGRPPIVLGSHDPLPDWAIRQSRCGLATFFDGSLDGLKHFGRGEGVAAGPHVHDPDTDSWNLPVVSHAAAGLNAVLVAFAGRRRGIVYRPGTPAPTGLADLAGRRIVPRQPESGTDRLFRELAARQGLELSRLAFADTARTEDEAVGAVCRGAGDAAFGLEAVARSYGLAFAPVIEERFALLVDRKAWFEPAFQTLMGFCAGAAFRARAAASGGYDVDGLGSVLWNA